MKRILCASRNFIYCCNRQCAANSSQKSTYVAKENSIFHANQVVATNTKKGMTLVVWERVTSGGRQITGRILNNRGAAAQEVLQCQ